MCWFGSVKFIYISCAWFNFWRNFSVFFLQIILAIYRNQVLATLMMKWMTEQSECSENEWQKKAKTPIVFVVVVGPSCVYYVNFFGDYHWNSLVAFVRESNEWSSCLIYSLVAFGMWSFYADTWTISMQNSSFSLEFSHYSHSPLSSAQLFHTFLQFRIV